MKNKIIWRKPDYKNEYGKVSDKTIDKLIESGSCSTGDIKIERFQYGRKITFRVFRVEKIGEMVQGLDTLSRTKAIEELKKLEKLNTSKGSKANNGN